MLQPRHQEPRIRSRSRSRNPKPYNPDSTKRYGPNESRSRKPPQPPKVEDGGFGDDGVRMRGKLEQKPVIIDLDSKGEPLPFQPDQDLAPLTSQDSDESYSGSESDDSRYSPEPEKSKDRTDRNMRGAVKVPNKANGHWQDQENQGTRHRPRLDTGFHQNGSLPARLPQLERARSPYVSAPRETRPQEPHHFSGEQVLSPVTLNPNNHRTGVLFRSQRPSEPIYHYNGDRGSGSGSGSDRGRGSNDLKRPYRPTLDRRASAMPILESKTSPKSSSRHRLKENYHSSSEEFEVRYTPYKANPTQLSPDPKAKMANSSFDTRKPGLHRRPSEQPCGSKHPSSSARTPVAAEQPKWGESLNREALLNVSAALLGTNAVLENQQRKASPRPSPSISPKESPHPSPPKTPTEPHHNREIVLNLKHDSPKSNSKPSSAHSSAPSSPKPVEAIQMSHHRGQDAWPAPQPYQSGQDARPARPLYQNDQDARMAGYMPRSRATSPLPQARRAEPEPPKIDIRSPSPLPMRPVTHSKSSSQEKNETRTPSRYMPEYASGATLQPARSDRRPRSLSNADARGSRPTDLTINPIAPYVIHQADVEYLSPTSENTPSHLNSPTQHMGRPSLLGPTGVDGRSRTSSVADPARSIHRSRSSVAAPNAAAPRSSSAVPPPTNRHRSSSSAAVPQLALSDQPNPGALPHCPRPSPVSGYNDWYTLKGCENFAICPECRRNIFGLGYERYFKPRSSAHPGEKTHCQINDPWIRMACIASINSKQPDVALLTKLANVSDSYEPCLGPAPVERDWYRVEDENADEDDHLADFQVCPHCVHSVEALLPTLKGTFFRYKGHQIDSTPRPCSLRFDTARFAAYVDKCEKAAQEAGYSLKEPDMSDFVWFHKKETVISECTHEHVLIGRDWHLTSLIPEFAICELCYYETVRPAIAKNYRLAKSVSPAAKHISDGVSCQLYSPRMKEIFERACREDDEEYLKQAVLIRRKLQVEILAARMAVQQRPNEWVPQKELDELMDNWRRLEKKRH